MKSKIIREFKTATGATLTLIEGGLKPAPEEQPATHGPSLLPMEWLNRQLAHVKEQHIRREGAAKAEAKPTAKRAPTEKPPVRAKSRAQVFFMREQLRRLDAGLPLQIKGKMPRSEIEALANTPLDNLPDRVGA